ncbi:MAG TPA: YqgE/AlgH family protein [Solirubrobacteraceae bacterium]|nr:YqgE/AlgH family protein [Solirubrobacteraceae bacterium]
MDSLRGKLLIAPPTMLDPNFERTVVLVAAHDEEGALGLVLNRPLDTPLEEISPELRPLVEPGTMLHSGGPVAPDSAVVLADFQDTTLASLMIFGTVGFPSAECELSDLVDGARRARVFAGHSGWGPGQLDGELGADGWIVGQLAPDELWQADSAGLWATALRRKGGSYALLATMPEDPSVN